MLDRIRQTRSLSEASTLEWSSPDIKPLTKRKQERKDEDWDEIRGGGIWTGLAYVVDALSF